LKTSLEVQLDAHQVHGGSKQTRENMIAIVITDDFGHDGGKENKTEGNEDISWQPLVKTLLRILYNSEFTAKMTC